jgi:hypothetical protein
MVMTTLGLGDITFQSDAGRIVSVVVLLSGVFMLLIVMPFVFMRAVYEPWVEQRNRSRMKGVRRVPETMPPTSNGRAWCSPTAATRRTRTSC